MKTKERCLQHIENINDTAEKMMVGSQFRNLSAEVVDTQFRNIIRWCEYLQDNLDQETED